MAYPKFNTTEWELLSTHLETIQTLSKEEQVAYLAQIKRDTPHLYDWVEKLAAADLEFGHVLDNAQQSLESVQLMTQVASLEGQTMGRYQLLEQIGEGGMGEVYLGRRVDDFEQKVAIKVFRYAFMNQQLLRRFEKEQRLLARLQHTSIANFIDAGLSTQGIPFLVMEYVNGEDLKRYAEEQNPSIETRIQWIVQLCEALQYLHTNLVVHRDIKPSNILVLPNGHIKVLDFGIAKVLEAVEDQSSDSQTKPFQYVLTPNYASPEQLWGKPVSVISDLYSVGVVMYELLTEQLPYLVTDKNISVLETIFSQQPQVPSETLLKKGKRGIKGIKDLDTIVLKTLSFDPNARYQSAALLADDLKRWLNQEPIAAKPQTWQYKASRFIARNKRLVIMATLLLITLLTSLAFTLWQSKQIQDESSKTSRVLAFLEQVLIGYDPTSPNPVVQDSTASRQLIQNSLMYLKTLPTEDTEVRLRVLNLLSGIAFSRSETSLADSLNQLAQKTSTQALPSPTAQADLWLQTAKISWLKQEFKEGLVAVDRGLALTQSQNIELQKLRRNLFNIKFLLFMELGNVEDAKESIVAANIITTSIFGAQSLEYALQSAQMAALASYNEDFASAVDALQKSIDIYKLHHQEDHYFMSSAYNNLSLALKKVGQKEAAIVALDKAIQISEKLFGAKHKEVVTCYINKASSLYEFGRLDEAVALLKKMIPLADHNGGETQQTVYYNLAFILQDQGHLEEAKQWALKALALRETIFPPDHADILRTRLLLGELYQESHQLVAAEQYFQQIIQVTQAKQPISSRYVRALLKIAWIRIEQNQLNAADKIILEVKEKLPKLESVTPMLKLDAEAIEAWHIYKKTNTNEAKSKFQTILQNLKQHPDKDIVMERMYTRLLQ
jgi:serine/threonine-protein kinase